MGLTEWNGLTEEVEGQQENGGGGRRKGKKGLEKEIFLLHLLV